MQETKTAQIQTNTENWNTEAPYSAMLRDYAAASNKVLLRIAELRAALRQMQNAKAGTAASAKAQLLLEQRIQMLRSEYEDLRDIMHAVKIYAEREVQR